MNLEEEFDKTVCVGICNVIDGRCIGCQRTLKEIEEHGNQVFALRNSAGNRDILPGSDSRSLHLEGGVQSSGAQTSIDEGST